MDLLIPLLIVGIIAVILFMKVPALVMHTIGQLLLGRVDDYEGWCYYGTLLERSGHVLQAYNAYVKSLEINPTYFKAQEHLDSLILKMEGNVNTSNLSYKTDLDL